MVIKDDIIASECLAKLKAIPNLTIVKNVEYVPILGLRVTVDIPHNG